MAQFDHPWLLWLLPLAMLPLIRPAGHAVRNTWALLVPRDRASAALDWALRLAEALALAALVIGLAGPYRPEYKIERIGKGAEIVLVLDRSYSMDQGFAGARSAVRAPKGTGPEAIQYYAGLAASRVSKGQVARQVLSEFAARRPDDRFGMVVFSTLPIRVLDFTQKPEAIQAAIMAGNLGRGLSETNIGLAMASALSFFEGRPYTAARIVMLISDGGDRLDTDAQQRIRHLADKYRVSIYWVYLRSANSPGLVREADEPAANVDAVPEYALHRYFESLKTPYRAYEAGDPQSLQQALDAVDRQETLPIAYSDTVPRRELAPAFFATACCCVLLLFAASLLEVRRWQ